MKARDALRVSTIRMVRAAIQGLEIARTDRKDPKFGQPITEGDLFTVVQREMAQRREALDYARQMGRNDLVAREEAALTVLGAYVPIQLTREEIVAEVEAMLAELGRDFRAVMPVAARRLRGCADMRVVNEVVTQLIHGALKDGSGKT